MAADRELDALIRRVDEDRWLASRFAPPDVRAKLIALYAVNYEIARTAEVVREPPLGAIRLQWWRDALDEMAAAGPPRDHPALRELARVYPSAAAQLSDVAEAHQADFDAAPFATWTDLERYVYRTAGEVMRLAVDVAAPDPEERLLELAWPAAHAWGYTGILRAMPFWESRGRSALPREDGARDALIERAAYAFDAARRMGAVPAPAFPAVGYVALVPGYLRALRGTRGEPALLWRQMKLVLAAAAGRF